MTGSIRQRSPGSWELRVFAGVDPHTHRRRYLSKTVRGNRAEAKRELAAMVEHAGTAPAIGSRTTMAELLERWFAIAAVQWAPTTIRSTRSILDRQLLPHVGRVHVGELTPAMIDDLYVNLRASGGATGRPLKAGTVARVRVVIHSALAQAMRWGWIFDNPAERAARLTTPPVEQHPPTPVELSLLLRHVEEADPVLHLLLSLAATTGARRAELLGLRWRNIRLDVRRVAFTAGWVEGPDGPVLAATKPKRSHACDLDAHTAELIRAHAERCPAEAGGTLSPDGFLFTDVPGGRDAWKPNRVTKAFIRARRAAGLRPFRLHDLRHFMATEMLNAGVPLPVVARRLDHARASTTLNFYAHAVPGGDAAAAEMLSRRLREGDSRSPETRSVVAVAV